jgi:hypothetical protein
MDVWTTTEYRHFKHRAWLSGNITISVLNTMGDVLFMLKCNYIPVRGDPSPPVWVGERGEEGGGWRGEEGGADSHGELKEAPVRHIQRMKKRSTQLNQLFALDGSHKGKRFVSERFS